MVNYNHPAPEWWTRRFIMQEEKEEGIRQKILFNIFMYGCLLNCCVIMVSFGKYEIDRFVAIIGGFIFFLLLIIEVKKMYRIMIYAEYK